MKRRILLAGSVVVVSLAVLLWVTVPNRDFSTVVKEEMPASIEPKREPVHEQEVRERSVAPVLEPELPSEAAGKGVISGAVYTTEGELGTGATVTLFVVPATQSAPSRVNNDSAQATAAVGSDGRFSISGLAWGQYAVAASLSGARAVKRVRLSERSPAAEVALILASGGAISGVVVDEAGAPVTRARVEPLIHDGDDLWEYESAPLVVKSDGEGRFEIAGLQPTAWELYVSAKGFAPTLTPPIRVGTTDARIVLARGVDVAGVTVDAKTREPMGGVWVSAKRRELRTQPIQAVSNETGAFELKKLAAERYVIDVTTEPLVLEGGPIEIDLTKGAPDSPLTLAVLQGGAVDGRVIEAETGAGIPDVIVRALPSNPAAARKESAPSEADGHFTIAGLARGTYRIAAGRIPGFAEVSRTDKPVEVSITPGEVISDLEVPVYRGITVSGTVVDLEGKPVPIAEVRAVGEPQWQGQTVADGEGRFVLGGVPAETDVTLNANAMDAMSRNVGPLHVPPTGLHDVTITLDVRKDALIAGQVVDARGQPLEAQIAAWGKDVPFPAMPAMGESDVTGRFVLANVAPGTYDIQIRPQQGEQKSGGEFTVLPGQVMRGVRLVYPSSQATLAITGKVRDKQGVPLRASVQYFRTSGGMSSFGGFAHTRHDGTFEMTKLEPGVYMLEVSASGYAPESLSDIEAGTAGLEIVLGGRGQIAGQVVDTTGRPVTAFDVAAVLGSPGRREGPPREDLFHRASDPEGRFSLDVEPAAYTVVVRAEGYLPAEQYLSWIDSDEVRDGVVITLQLGNTRISGVVVGENGRGVSGAHIFLGMPPDHPEHAMPSAAARTNDAGRFEVTRVPEGPLQLTAFHPQQGIGNATVDVRANVEQSVTITIRAGGVVEGTVRIAGKPAPGLLVRLETDAGQRRMVETDEQGQYRIEGLTDGAGTLHVEWSESSPPESRPAEPVSQRVEFAAGAATTVDFDI